jgi:FkbM family methyltransferase
MYAVTQGTFRTPRGRSVTMKYRTDTNDWNTLNACMSEDEYRLAELNLSGTALDVGAHIGGVTISLALDNPDLRVVAVEAVPPNVDLLFENVEANGLSDRVTVLNAAAGKGKTATIRWAFAGNESADHHAFIGNAVLPASDTRVSRSEKVDVRTLSSLVKEFGPFSFAKVDCENCEFDFLHGKALRDVALIRGEYHSTITPLWIALKSTHSVTWEKHIPGGFEAVAR